MRALEAGMSIAVGRVDSVPVGVDPDRNLDWVHSFSSADGARVPGKGRAGFPGAPPDRP